MGEKKHLSGITTWPKRFYDHMRGIRDNLKILDFCILVGSLFELCYRISHTRLPEIRRNPNFQIISSWSRIVAEDHRETLKEREIEIFNLIQTLVCFRVCIEKSSLDVH